MAESSAPDGTWLNDPKMIKGVLRFLISKLSPADAEELDRQLTGESTAMASDHRLDPTPDVQKDWLNYGPTARQNLRGALTGLPRHGGRPLTLDEMRRADPEAAKSFEERFGPNATRLRG